jgi:hypothetical protein
LYSEECTLEENGFDAMLCQIDAANFQTEVLGANKPVLVAWLRNEADFSEQKEDLKDLSEDLTAIKVYLAGEEGGEFVKKQLRILGTPTYLILEQGKERDRMLGKTDKEALRNFVVNTLGLSL